MEKLPYHNNWDRITHIKKGWSQDRKYLVKYEDHSYLLRLFDLSEWDNKIKEFDFITLSRKVIPCSNPLEYGRIPENPDSGYLLLSFIEGRELSECLGNLSLQRQYDLGFEAGTLLKKLHSIALTNKISNEAQLSLIRDKKIRQLNNVMEKNYSLEHLEEMADYVRENIDLVLNQSIVYQHGDYHPGNMIYTPSNTLSIIDFNRWDIGDPFEEFVKIELFTVESSEAFALGQIEGYFKNQYIPDHFWQLLKVYSFHSALFSILWAEQFGEDDVNGMIQRYNRIYADYREDEIPCWIKDTKMKLKVGEDDETNWSNSHY